MKIKDDYINKLTQNTNEIENSIKRLGLIEYNLNLLQAQKTKILQYLNNLDTDKQDLVKAISQEYGQGYIDPNTWQFYPKEEKEQK